MRYKIKLFLILVLLLIGKDLSVQLTYLGLDKIRTFDGYKKGFYSGGIVSLMGKYYFSTPNGNLFQSDGSMAGTVLSKVSQRDIVTLKATNKFLYYSSDWGYGAALRQFDPVSGNDRSFGHTDMTMPSDRLCPSCEVPQSEAFVSHDGSRLLTRSFVMGLQYIREVDDSAAAGEVSQVFKSPLPTAGIDFQLIKGDTRVDEIRDEVYFNGNINFTSAQNVETSVTVFQKSDGDKIAYKLLTDYRLKAKGITIYQDFLRTPSALYVVASKEGNEFFLMKLEREGMRQLRSFPEKVSGYACNVIRGQLYITCRDRLYRYDEAGDRLVLIHQLSNFVFQPISGGVTMLKVGDYFMFRQDGMLKVLNEIPL